MPFMRPCWLFKIIWVLVVFEFWIWFFTGDIFGEDEADDRTIGEREVGVSGSICCISGEEGLWGTGGGEGLEDSERALLFWATTFVIGGLILGSLLILVISGVDFELLVIDLSWIISQSELTWTVWLFWSFKLFFVSFKSFPNLILSIIILKIVFCLKKI